MLGLNAVSTYFLYPFGLIYICWATAVVAVFKYAFLVYLFKDSFNLSIKKQLMDQLPVLILTIACSVWAILFDLFIIPFNVEDAYITVPILAISTFLVWATTVFILNHPLKIELLKLIHRKAA
jgi:hypothetical protein